jgi:hypothetical protein
MLEGRDTNGAMNRFPFLALWLVVACGGSSKGTGDDPGTGGLGATGGSGGSGGSGAKGAKGAKGGTTGGTAGGSGGNAGTLPDPGSGGSESGSSGSGAAGATAGSAAGGSGAVAAQGGAGGSDGPCGPGGCVAGTMNVSPLEPPGPVLCGGVECGAGEVCCLPTSQCYDPATDAEACAPPEPDMDPWGRTPCSSNAQCGEKEYCASDVFAICQGTGHCQPIGNCGTCDDGGTGACRVCACDGNTYPDPQTACRAGANVINVTGAGCGESVIVGGGGAKGEGTTITVCATDANCGAEEACCALTTRCYPTAQPDHCRVPPEGTTFPCITNDDCLEGSYCHADTCDGPGGCKVITPGDCGVVIDPVCGCDGTSYTSADCAESRGVRIASAGECSAK